MMRSRLFILMIILAGGALLALASASAAVTQEYHIDWYAVAGGGGSAQSTGFAIDGTVGQSTTGELEGEDYRVSGGYWGAMMAPAPPPAQGLYLPLIEKG